MERQDALNAYIEAIKPEQEQYLLKHALASARAITRGMTSEQQAEYRKSRAFQSALYRARKSDGVYQGLERGELTLDAHRAEFERLCPLILSEMRKERPIDLPFLRSVSKSRVTLKKAHAALEALASGKARRHLEAQKARFQKEGEARLETLLKRAELSSFLNKEQRSGQVLEALMADAFARGVPDKLLEQAWQPKSLTEVLRGELYRVCPELGACGSVCTPGGKTVQEVVREELRRAKNALNAALRKRFLEDRLRGLLRQNPSVRRMQKQADALNAKERRLRTALLNAIPEHYRDLYPLARGMKRRFILHLGPTNSGKTYEGVERLRWASRGIYLGPLRLLAAEQFETLNAQGVPCSLVTGEEQIRVPNSLVQSSTVEMADLSTHYDVAVIDECQMISDRERGGAWTAAILGLCADEIHACASPDAEALLRRIITECGDELTIVRHKRMTPLVAEKENFQFPQSVRPGDALIVFSKARVHAVAAELKRKGFRVALIYGALPPDVRRDQAQRFQDGDAEVVVSTDAIAMGMNLPIQRVVFLESEKYDGDITRPLTDAEIKQIAGRAGRYGQYDVGYVNAFGFKGAVAQALNKPLAPLTEAVIRFPESLLGIPLPLTQIIDQWLIMQDKSCFSKASTERMAALAAMLETPRTDKELLYRFLCVPFDETDPDLLLRWRAMYRAESAGEHVDVLREIPEELDPDICVIQMLDGLEADYRRCDLYYNYARLFLPEPDLILEEIQHRKDLISQGIIHILSTQKLPQKTCPNCRCPLPWNWPYRLCDDCHQSQLAAAHRGRRGRGWR